MVIAESRQYYLKSNRDGYEKMLSIIYLDRILLKVKGHVNKPNFSKLLECVSLFENNSVFGHYSGFNTRSNSGQ